MGTRDRRIKDRHMKNAGYISILILFIFGCAGRTEKMRDESEMIEAPAKSRVFKPACPELVAMYNEGRIDEFYVALDTIKVEKPSSVIKPRVDDIKRSDKPFSPPAALEIPIKINQDSLLVTILILDLKEKLLWIEYNDALRNGDYVYFNHFPNIESGIYHYLLKVGTKEMSRRFVLLR